MTFPNARLVGAYTLVLFATGYNVLNRNKEAFVPRRIFHLSQVAHRARISSDTDRRLLPKYSAIFRHLSRSRFIRIILFFGVFQVIVKTSLKVFEATLPL